MNARQKARGELLARRSTYKLIGYAYASSPNAARLGFGKTGCYLVAVRDTGCGLKVLAGYATAQEAMDHAYGLAEPWEPAFLTHMAPEILAAYEARVIRAARKLRGGK